MVKKKTPAQITNELEKPFEVITRGWMPEKPHLAKGEVADLRRDVEAAFKKMLMHPSFSTLMDVPAAKLVSQCQTAERRVKYCMGKLGEYETQMRDAPVYSRIRQMIDASVRNVSSQYNGLKSSIDGLWALARRNESEHATSQKFHTSIGKGMSGDVQFSLSLDRTVSASDLNAALAGTYVETFSIKCESLDFLIHTWAKFIPTLVATKTTVDVDIGVPTLSNNPLVDGRCLVDVTFDTDAGATKTYAAGDEVSVEVKVRADDTLFGWAVASSTITFTVV